jgi:hypothetical protein
MRDERWELELYEGEMGRNGGEMGEKWGREGSMEGFVKGCVEMVGGWRGVRGEGGE